MDRLGFRRLVVGLQPRAPGQGLELAAELAGLLDLDLFGLFIEDTGLLGLGALPFAREIGTPGGEWRALEAGQILRDLRLAASASERRLATAMSSVSVSWRFEVVRGSAAGALGAAAGTDDIVVILEPAGAAERATQPFTALVEAAWDSRAAVLLVPQRLARRSGPVAAIVTATGDLAADVAAAIAEAAGEDCVVLAGGEPRAPAAALAGSLAGSLAMALGRRGERLVVASRAGIGRRVAAELAAARGVPVLVVGS